MLPDLKILWKVTKWNFDYISDINLSSSKKQFLLKPNLTYIIQVH